MKFPFVGPTYTMDARSFDVQRCINFYPMISESGTSKEQSALRSVPGYEKFCEIGGGPIRGGFSTSLGRLFLVSGFDVFEVFENGASEQLGSLLTSTGIISCAENGDEVIIVDGKFGYIITLETGDLDRITDPNFPETDIVDFQDGYFLVPEKGTPKFAISGLYDGFSWAADDFTVVESNPDNLVSLISDHGNAWLFGTRSVEVYQNTASTLPSGNPAFPFERIPGAIVQTGCAAAHTVKKFDNTIAWLGVDEQGRGVVWKANGYNAQRLSTQSIEARIASADDFTESYAYVYHEQGHVFYCLQVKGLDTTLVYDASVNQWHERSYHDQILNQRQPYRAANHFFFGQMNLIGDRLTGTIYRQSLSLYSFDGEEIHRERISPHIQQEKRLLSFTSFELDMEVGIGLVAGQGSDPQVMMCYSNDGGNTWSAERWASAGKTGRYKNRVKWHRLGSARDRVWRVRITDAVFVQINGAYINAA